MTKKFRVKNLSTLLLLGLFTTGCSSTIHKRASVNGIETLSIDAKQRLMLVNANGGPNQNKKITCTEPSPDAIVAQAAALSANITTPQALSAALGGSSTETAGSIGLRTPTIQILRDGYFRICEAYLNGAIDEDKYRQVINHVDGVIAVALAIDTLGGTAAPAVIVAPSGAITSAAKDGATAEAKPGSVVIENIISERGTLSDAQAQAIENITTAYIRAIKARRKSY